MDKVLIVDGDSSVRDLLAQELADDGYMVVAIGKPESIPDILDTFEPDVLVLDVFMNGKMKWDVWLEIKKQRPRLPVLIFTCTYPDGDLGRLPIEGWVVKSFLFDELKEKIRGILKRRFGGANLPGLTAKQLAKDSNAETLNVPLGNVPQKISVH